MVRGKGIRRHVCYCKACKGYFRATREDAVTCSDKCRKAWNRLLGGTSKRVADLPDGSAQEAEASSLSVTKER